MADNTAWLLHLFSLSAILSWAREIGPKQYISSSDDEEE
jgi:hypothetical protein